MLGGSTRILYYGVYMYSAYTYTIYIIVLLSADLHSGHIYNWSSQRDTCVLGVGSGEISLTLQFSLFFCFPTPDAHYRWVLYIYYIHLFSNENFSLIHIISIPLSYQLEKIHREGNLIIFVVGSADYFIITSARPAGNATLLLLLLFQDL